MERHLFGTMFDRSRVVERVLSTGTVVRLRVEELEGGRVMVHEARRRRVEGDWERWPEFEGEQSASELCLERSIVVEGG
jgi:uncharacterized protein (DUF1015 family)